MFNKNMRGLFICLGLLLGLTNTVQAALIQYTYTGAAYVENTDDLAIVGQFNGLNQMKATLYVDEALVDENDPVSAASMYWNGSAFYKGFEIYMSDGRFLVDSFSGTPAPGYIHFSYGVPTEWDIRVSYPSSTNLVPQDGNWVDMRMIHQPTGRYAYSGDSTAVWKCLANCWPSNIVSKEFAIERGSTGDLLASQASGLFSTSAVDPAIGWVRTPGTFERLEDGSYVSVVPVPASVWLFGSALVGLLGIKRRR